VLLPGTQNALAVIYLLAVVLNLGYIYYHYKVDRNNNRLLNRSRLRRLFLIHAIAYLATLAGSSPRASAP